MKRILGIASRFAKNDTLASIIAQDLEAIREAGTFKDERIIKSPQDSEITVGEDEVINMCANNYLGLSSHPRLIEGAKAAMDEYGMGMSSVRFICGTQDQHKELEDLMSEFHGTEDTILYSSCFDANAGFFEAILTPEDAIISDALNHASIIDGVRLCKAQRHRYDHMDMDHLEQILKDTQDCRLRLIATDGAFSMDGDIAPLDEILELKNKYDALLFVDDSHATGFFGDGGRGTYEYFNIDASDIDVINSTLGKALGGASGGYTTGRKDIVDKLRQVSRPYLFSNSVCPPIIGSTKATIEMLMESTELRDVLMENTKFFREEMVAAGFDVWGHEDCPIVPIFLGDAKLATEFANEMLERNIYVIGFSFPVVPRGEARIRVQLSAAHTPEMVKKAVDAFIEIGQKKGVIS